MGIVTAGLGLALIIVIAVPLAVLRAGIRRQDRISLTSRPAGLSAALARRVLGLHASLVGAAPVGSNHELQRESLLAYVKKGPGAS